MPRVDTVYSVRLSGAIVSCTGSQKLVLAPLCAEDHGVLTERDYVLACQCYMLCLELLNSNVCEQR